MSTKGSKTQLLQVPEAKAPTERNYTIHLSPGYRGVPQETTIPDFSVVKHHPEQIQISAHPAGIRIAMKDGSTPQSVQKMKTMTKSALPAPLKKEKPNKKSAHYVSIK